MTRFGFFLFNILFIAAIYGFIHMTGAKHEAFRFTITFVSLPHVAVALFMAILAIIRWFINQNPEAGREITTFLNLLWIVPTVTALAIKLAGGAPRGWGEIIRLIY